MTSPQNNEVRIGIGYNLDESSVNRTINALEATDKNILDIQAQAKAGSREIALFARAQAQAAESSQDATKAINDSVDALRDEAKAAEDSADAIAKRNQKLQDTPDVNTKSQADFAGQSGDRASIAGQTRGALDALTGGNAGVFGQALEGAEAVFDLGEAAGKLGGPVGSAVTALGPAGLAGAAGLAGVALVALNLLFAEWKKRAEEAKKVQEALNNEILELAKMEVEGATSEDLAKHGEDLQNAADAAVLGLERLQKQYENQFATMGPLEELWTRLTKANEAQLVRGIEAQETVVAQTQAAVDVHEDYVATLDDTQIAANDAAAAERSLAEARTASLLTEAAQAGELEALRLRAMDLTQEQIDAELKALEVREASIKAELATLEASGDTSEEVAAKIAQLSEQLGFLGEQADVLKAAKPTAKSEAAEKAAEEARAEREKREAEAEREREKQAQESQRKLDDARRAQDQYTQAVASAKTAFSDAKADIKTGLIDSLADINQDLQDSLNEQTIEFNQNELKEEAQFQRDLAQISRDAKRSELDATRQRDFAAAREARENAAEAIADRKDDERAANEDQLIEFRQAQEALGRERDIAARDAELDATRQLRDAASARDRGIRDAQAAHQTSLRNQNQYYNQSLSMEQKFLDTRLRMQQQALDSLRSDGSTSRTSSTTSSRQRTSSTFNELQLILDSR